MPLARIIVWLTVLFQAIGFAGGQSAVAGAFSVVPQIIQLKGDSRTSMVEVRNSADAETVFQVETFAWEDSTALEDLKATRDVLAVPAVFRLAPDAVQIVRVASRVSLPPQASEKSYRLLISEVPPEGDGGVVFALRMSLPVFLTPDGARASLSFKLAPGGRELRVANAGAAHLRMNDLRIVERGSGRLLETIELRQPAYILPGRTRSYSLPGAVDPGRIRLEADTTAGQFRFDPQ